MWMASGMDAKAFVFGQALMVAVINLLNDYGKFETRETRHKMRFVKDRFPVFRA